MVEKVSESAYTLCKLSTDVRMKEIRRKAQTLRKSSTVCTPNYMELGKQGLEKEWWAGLVTLELGVQTAEGTKRDTFKFSMMHPGLQQAAPTNIMYVVCLCRG